MFETHPNYTPMSLFTDEGERKYLNRSERKRFYKARTVIKDLSERLFVEVLYWTGCRISEALQLTIMRVNVEDSALIFRTLKQHGEHKGKRYRIVPIPSSIMKRLNRTHSVSQIQTAGLKGQDNTIWNFGRQKGLKLVKAVMNKAQIFGIRATAKGLRHTFGVNAAMRGIPLPAIQDWMGHQDINTTLIYVRIIGSENRSLAKRMWQR